MRTTVFWGFLIILGSSLCAGAYTVAGLEWIASTEAVPEISQAAGLALVDTYAATKSAAELTELAMSTRVGIAYAARSALRALDDPVSSLVLLGADELWERAREASSSEERLDAARAYFLATRASASLAFLEQEAVSDESTEWALAAGEMLGGFYAAYGILSADDLADRIIVSPHPGMRRAASVALTALWVADGVALTDDEIEVKLVELTQWKPDLAAAYMGLLAHRFLVGLGPS